MSTRTTPFGTLEETLHQFLALLMVERATEQTPPAGEEDILAQIVVAARDRLGLPDELSITEARRILEVMLRQFVGFSDDALYNYA